MPHGSVGTLTSQDLTENLGNLKSNAPMDEDESVNGTGAPCQGGMARGSDSVEKPSNLTFGAEQLVDPAPMDEDEGVDGTGAISQGRIACGSDAVQKPGNLSSGVEQHVNPAPMDEDEGVDGNGANSQGGIPRGSVSALTTQDLVKILGNLNSIDETEDVDRTGAQGGCPDEDLLTGSAAENQSGSMIVDGSDSDIDKIFGTGLHSASSSKPYSMQ